MLTQALTEALNAELTRERTAVATYMALAGKFHSRNLMGFYRWGVAQSHEEATHVDKFLEYLCDREVVPLLDTVASITVPSETDLIPLTLAALTDALTLEQTVTEALKQIHAQAESDEDPATAIFLQPFIMEQVQAEQELGNWIGYLKDTGLVGLVALNTKLEGK